MGISDYNPEFHSLSAIKTQRESPMALDGLGIYNAIHEEASRHTENSRYDRSPGPMGYWAAKGRKAVLADFTVEVVEYDTQSDTSRYEEHGIGWTGKCFIIFKITPKLSDQDSIFYKLEGTVDSYDGEHWDGKFYPVSPKIENVTVYRWE